MCVFDRKFPLHDIGVTYNNVFEFTTSYTTFLFVAVTQFQLNHNKREAAKFPEKAFDD